MTSIPLPEITSPLLITGSAIHIIGGAIVAGGGVLFGFWVFREFLSWYFDQRQKRNARPHQD